MAHRDIAQHRMGVAKPSTGRCQTMVMPGVMGRTGMVVCNMLPSHPCHRFYPCRSGCGPDIDFLSCESRDRHEANAHGSGW
jgi:hypothetical protein